MARVRLSEVAARAGVTTGAASQALNGLPGVSAETRERIRALAQEMGYVPHRGAQSLSRGRTNTWGVFLDGDPQVWSLWLEGAMELGVSQGYHVELHKLPARPRRAEAFARVLAESRLDGLILLDLDGDDPTLRALWGSKIPTVVSGRRSHWFDCVEIHDRLAQEEVLWQLSLDGKRPVALVATRDQIEREDARIAVWDAHSQQHKAPLLAVENDAPESGVTALGQLLRNKPRPQAVLSLAGDRTAWGMLRESRLRKISVPGDLAIAGWGDSPYSDWLDPELTTVRIPWAELGQKSAKLLQERLAKPGAPRVHRTLDALLVNRRSA